MFDRILQDCRAGYRPFSREVEKKREPLSFAEAIRGARGNAVIAEIKFSSPGGRVRNFEPPAEIAKRMQSGGACAISVLTERKYFSGRLDYLGEVKSSITLPVLRKDFIFHPRQVDESYYYGADSLLLISSFFSASQLRALMERSRSFGMEPLVEVHSGEDAARAEKAGTEIFVVNNRNKDTLEVDLGRSEELAGQIDGLKVSASGITTREELRYVLGYCDAALVGTSLMKSRQIEKAVEGLVHA